jgi:hypothetical protein
MDFERPLSTEPQDIAEIVAGILSLQGRYAHAQQRPLGRGTHTKGVCARASVEVFDLANTVGDPLLARRLGRGLFAKPGAYPATVRFANAFPSLRPDSTPDVRALSFAIAVPAGVLGPGPVRLDFSLNSATTFPINDARAFAALMRVRTASGFLGHTRALASLSFADVKGLLHTARNGIKQENAGLHPYQQTRYWSNVPFLHGRDEAVKFAATPAPDNGGRKIRRGVNVLRDELVRHLKDDPSPARFDIGIQLLEPEQMTFRGRRQVASFWVENASIAWPESQAPFHTVGRLTLDRGSVLADDDVQCQSMYIDVTEYSLPDHRPIGSLNRARATAESASRKARFAAGAGGQA